MQLRHINNLFSDPGPKSEEFRIEINPPSNPVDLDIPISSLSELNIRVTDKYGNNVDFLNYDFSFTLRIYELTSKPRDTMLIKTNYYEELLKKLDKDTL